MNLQLKLIQSIDEDNCFDIIKKLDFNDQNSLVPNIESKADIFTALINKICSVYKENIRCMDANEFMEPFFEEIYENASFKTKGLDWIYEFPEVEWLYYYLHKHPDFTFDEKFIVFLKNNPYKNWNYSKLFKKYLGPKNVLNIQTFVKHFDYETVYKILNFESIQNLEALETLKSQDSRHINIYAVLNFKMEYMENLQVFSKYTNSSPFLEKIINLKKVSTF